MHTRKKEEVRFPGRTPNGRDRAEENQYARTAGKNEGNQPDISSGGKKKIADSLPFNKTPKGVGGNKMKHVLKRGQRKREKKKRGGNKFLRSK